MRQPHPLTKDDDNWVGSRVRLDGKPTFGTVTRMGASKWPSAWVRWDDKEEMECFLYLHNLEKV